MHVDTITMDGTIFYQAVACDGWPTGPCPSREKAIERVYAYERCEEVSQAAPGQASYAQMHALLEVVRDQEAPRLIVQRAIAAGLHSEDWARASALMRSRSREALVKDFVIQAGGTYVRRRLPATQVPTHGA